jgi:hypothetical protein
VIIIIQEKGKLLIRISKDKFVNYWKFNSFWFFLIVILIYLIALLFGLSYFTSIWFGFALVYILGPIILILGIYIQIYSNSISNLEIYEKGITIPTPRNRDIGKKIYIQYNEMKNIYSKIGSDGEEELIIETKDNKKYFILNYFVNLPIKTLIMNSFKNSKK